MPNVTVTGAHGQTVTIPYHSAYDALLAQQLADVITAGVDNGTTEAQSNADGLPHPITPPYSNAGFFLSDTQIPLDNLNLDGQYKSFVDTVPMATVFDAAPDDQTVLSGEGDLTLDVTTGSGSIIAGGGDNDIILGAGDTGSWLVYTDSGNDQILANNTGSDTISAGLGKNDIQTGAGQDFITTTGHDTILAGSGSVTVAPTGSGSDFISGSSGNIYFVGGSATGDATLFGGSGSDTFEGGTGDAFVRGGTAGNNLLYAGTGMATLFGGGAGDQLYAQGAKSQLLHAGVGNETLSAQLSSGADTLVAGSGNDQLGTGSGADTLVAGTGNVTINAAFTPSNVTDVFQFIKGMAGGMELVQNLTSTSQIDINLSGYGANEETHAINTQSTTSGSLVVSLTDGTTITFQGITQKLTTSNFS